eukprot:3527042-Heterocapsa_arctica.AAC.1
MDNALAAKLRLVVKDKSIPPPAGLKSSARWFTSADTTIGSHGTATPFTDNFYAKLLSQFKDRADPKASADEALEGTLYKLILRARYAVSHRHRLSKRLLRWEINRPIGVVTDRAFTLIRSLSSLVPPMVTAAVIRTF